MATKLEQKFKEMSTEQRQANFAALDYIKSLASNTGTNISRWNILKFFGADDGVNLIKDKKAINKIFFERLQRKDNDEEPEEVSYDGMEKVKKTFINFVKTAQTERKNHIESTIKDSRFQIESYHSEIEKRLVKITKLSAELIAISSEDSIAKGAEELLKDVNSVIEEGLWINPVVDNSFLYLNTPNNIVLSHKNKSANVDYQVDMGQLAVKINIGTGDIRVIPYKSNLSYDRGERNYHPHVYSDGRVCLGNAKETIVKHISKFEYGKALRILHALLHLYNDGSPIVHLSYFRDASKMVYRLPESLKHPDRKKKPEMGPAEETVPTFTEGDTVEFELAGTTNEPRWNCNVGRASSGVWERGTVIRVNREFITIELSNGNIWEWINVGHDEYDPTQWARPGFLRHRR